MLSQGFDIRPERDPGRAPLARCLAPVGRFGVAATPAMTTSMTVATTRARTRAMKHALSLALTLALTWALATVLPSTAAAQSAAALRRQGGTSGSMFAGSTIGLQTGTTAIGLIKDAEPTWNPEVATTLTLAPRLNLGSSFFARGSFSLTRELTDSDWTSMAGETIASDTALAVGVRPWQSDALGLFLQSDLQIRLPTSKASMAQTLLVAPSLGATAIGSWKSRGGDRLTAVLSGRATLNVHRYTTASTETPWLTGCSSLAEGCARYSQTGGRNAASRLTGVAALSWAPVGWLEVGVTAGIHRDGLYPLQSGTTVNDVVVAPDPTDSNARYIAIYQVSSTFQVHPSTLIVFGAETANQVQRPDSQYRAVFFNRFTSFFLAVQVLPDQLLSALRDAPPSALVSSSP